MSVTIKDVAKQAEVAPSTVSRVLSDSSQISEKTKRKVRKVMEELGYHINLNARILVSKSTQTIGIVMKNSASDSFENPFFSELLRGISKGCHEKDFSINLTTGETEEAIFHEVVKMVQGKRVDGIVVLYSKKDDKVVPYLMEHNFPFVLIGKPLEDVSRMMYVDNDNVQASRDAVNFLISLGHQKISFIGADSNFEVAKDRLEGYKYAIQENQLEIRNEYLKNKETKVVDAGQIVKELMDLPEPPTAMVITDDILAVKTIRIMQDLHINVPGDVSVVGFNNTMIARLANPPLTTVDTDPYQLGWESCHSLIQLINEPDMVKRSIIIPTKIVKRASTNKKGSAV